MSIPPSQPPSQPPSGPRRHVGHIDEEVAAYAAHARAGDGAPGTVYSSEGLAEVYQPRVEQLLALKREGFIYAEWKWDPDSRQNRWHGLAEEDLPSPDGPAT